MRIVDRQTFLGLPAGTLFAKWKPHVADELTIKDDTTESGTDFWLQELIPWFEGANDSADFFEAYDKMHAGEPSPPLDYQLVRRDGLFHPGQMFLVFERADVERLIARLNQALEEGYKGP